MRILHINCNYLGRPLHQRMIEQMEALGIENHVFAPTYDTIRMVITPNANVVVSQCYHKNDRYLFDYKQAKIIKAVEANFDVASFDLIHAYTLFTDGNAAKVLSEKYSVPFVTAVRSTDVNDFFGKRILLRSRGIQNMLSAKAVFFLSETYRQQMLEKYVPTKFEKDIASKAHIMPNGIDNFWLDHTPDSIRQMDKSCIKLFYAGEITRNKNITTTQKAMALLRDRGIQTHLTVVGRIVEQAVYDEVVKDPYTTCMPAQPKEKLAEIEREHDIFVMPSRNETFGLVYAEAISQGLPVVYSMGQGFDGQFPEGEVGYHARKTDPEDIANAIEKIVQRYDELPKQCIESSRKFRWETICRQYIDIYTDLVGHV